MPFIYVGEVDEQGVSSLLNKGPNGEDIYQNVSSLIPEIENIFPERQKLHHVHPKWLNDNVLNITNECQISITFADEGAGYLNSIGYYIYPSDLKLKSFNQINNYYIIFPNGSKETSGGKLKSGDTIQLGYKFSQQNIDGKVIGTPTDYNFPKGVSIGFVLFANGWKNNKVSTTAVKYSSDSNLNPEQSQEHKYHTALVRLETNTNKLLMGFEDINRSEAWCDHDFNDFLCFVNVSSLECLDREVFVDRNAELPDAPNDYDVGYKKGFAEIEENGNNKITEVLIKLLIPKTSKVIHQNKFGKSRTNRAYVASITGCKPKMNKYNSSKNNYVGVSFNNAHSGKDKNFVYNIYQYITEESLDINPLDFGSGINYFVSRNQAEDYNFAY